MAGVGPRGGTRIDWTKAAARDPTQFLADVFVRPSIRPLAGWLIGALLGLVIALTLRYSPGAPARADLPHGADPTGVIPVWAGFGTVGFVTVVALVIGWEPVVRRFVGPGPAAGLGAWVRARGLWLRAPMLAIGRMAHVVWHAPATAFSVLDYLLVRPLAWTAGATLRPVWLRYGALLFWTGGGTFVALRAPAPWGLIGVAAGMLAVFAVVRRWTWVERDREAFFVARSADSQLMRVGFGEDLRDEALTAIVFLFALIPLGLRQIDMTFDAFDLIDAETGLALAGAPSPWQWIGFFGAELAKAAPFVDWSEVFHVANGSPIEPRTALGEQIVFAMRATLDLLLLAAVLQAVQIAARIVEQRAAFAAGRLPVLDPFAERDYFRPIGLAERPAPSRRGVPAL